MMDQCTTCNRQYKFALDWGTCPKCKDMYAKGYTPDRYKRVWKAPLKVAA